ncbi:MAG: hypothetical protein WDN00_02940 [Limisphaerales bacterium]
MTTTQLQLIETPANVSLGGASYQHLAYVDAYDAVINCDYAFVAYKETDSNGDWRVRIKSSQTAGGVFEPAMMKSNARSTGAQGKPWFQWGYSFDPSASDARVNPVPRSCERRPAVRDRNLRATAQVRQHGGRRQVREVCVAGLTIIHMKHTTLDFGWFDRAAGRRVHHIEPRRWWLPANPSERRKSTRSSSCYRSSPWPCCWRA